MSKKEDIDFEEVFKEYQKPKGKQIHTSENTLAYILSIIFYFGAMILVPTILSLILVSIPGDHFYKTFDNIENSIYVISEQDANAMLILRKDEYDLHLNDYEMVVNLGLYKSDYVILVNKYLEIYNAGKDYEFFSFAPFDENTKNYIIIDDEIDKILSIENTTWNPETKQIIKIYGVEENLSTVSNYQTITNPKAPILTSLTNNLVNLTTYLAMLIGLIIILRKKILKVLIDFKNLKWKIASYIGIGIAVFFAAFTLSELLISLINQISKPVELVVSQNQLASANLLKSKFGFLSIISIILIGPIVEELVFRFATFKLINKKWVAVLISSTLFALMHISTEVILLIQGQIFFSSFLTSSISYLSMGVAFAGVHIFSEKNVLVPIIIHIGWNTIAVISVLLM